MRFSAPGAASRRCGPPTYYQRVHENAAGVWQKLDSDPELAGPWRQLFSQVQSPRHVLSELLQNADDAGATRASAVVANGQFCFRHDGADFTEEQFASLCRFGYSNKRNLHTIGFRGIGFKSAFSIGPEVDVLTPTLAVRFNRSHFTKPAWRADAEDVADTQIRVVLEDEHREAQLRKNLKEWMSSPVSLLFFSYIRSLEIDGIAIERQSLGPGPAPSSEWVGLSTLPGHRLLLVRSAYDTFPAEAVEEVRKERLSEEVELPPCRVEVVLGLPLAQRLYVVLPTGVTPDLPFSCNAPFVQDPARVEIKDPSVSPTNRWLLDRTGALAAETMSLWLENTSIPISGRAQAYELLPQPPEERDDLDSSVASIVCSAMERSIDESRVLLSEGGEIRPQNGCFAPPPPLYSVWSADQLLDAFGGEFEHVLSGAVSNEQRTRLSQWEWLTCTTSESVLRMLEGVTRPQRPASWAALAKLWQFATTYARYDYSGQSRRRLAIVPVLNADRLAPATEVVRVSGTRRGLAADDWRFIIDGLSQLHPDWVEEVQRQSSEKGVFAGLVDVLNLLGLAEATLIDRVVQHRARAFFAAAELDVEECVRFAHLLAALDATAPESFEYVARDHIRRTTEDGLFLDDGSLAQLVPEAWAQEHCLHSGYESTFVRCTRDQWQWWSRSTKSGLSNASFFEETAPRTWNWNKRDVEQFLESRGVEPPDTYHYRSPSFTVVDHDFDGRLRSHWNDLADADPAVWGKVVDTILGSPTHDRASVLYADVYECHGAYTRRLQCDRVPAQWIIELRGRACLRDTHGVLREPAQLLLRSAETEPLLGAEPFVNADFDTVENHELLLLLGARATPAGADSILNRIRALAEVESPPLTELGKWYDALDRVLARRRPDDLEAIRGAFDEQALIYTQQQEWGRRGEVFQRLYEDDPPGLPTVHPEYQSLALWAALGVAERPSPDLLVQYVAGLESRAKLDGGQLKRVRSVLREQPTRIWHECGHWLALDGSWQPVEELELILFDDSAVRVRELFPAIKASTADGRSIRPEARSHDCFARLNNLAACLTYRPTEVEGALAGPEQRQWLTELGSWLARIRLEDQELVASVRAAGARLNRTVWQPFQKLSVVPYLDASPAGQPHEPIVLWDDSTLYVRELSAAKVCDAVVAELVRSFGSEAVQRAIRSCYERDAGFIADYLSEHFEFDAVSPSPTGDESREAPPLTHEEESAPPPPEFEGGGQPDRPPEDDHGNQAPSDNVDPSVDPEGPPDESDAESSPEGPPEPRSEPELGPEPGSEPRSEPKPQPPKAEPLIAQFARSRGFEPGSSPDEWLHPDGSSLSRTTDIFPWVHQDADDVLQRYWLANQSLLRAGVDLGADVWDMLRKRPDECSLILVEDERPFLLAGAELVQMVRGESLELYPARYRLRRPE